MGKGKRFEMDIVNGVTEQTNSDVIAMRPDYSGNSKHAFADVVILEPPYWGSGTLEKNPHAYFIEAKKRTADNGKRCVVMAGSSDGDSGYDGLCTVIDKTPSYGKAYIVVKFNNREVIVLEAQDLKDTLDGGDEPPLCHGSRLTRGGNISMVKPELDWWPSSSVGEDDIEKIIRVLGVGDDSMDMQPTESVTT
jgi:Holliday junction resolvase